MKLLIADDEKLTREGIISSIDWTALGVSEIYQADDGIHGLELAKEIQPDIVLSDVRMPRMDGIEMSSRLKELFPNISIIFMSGYSDKEYLKAAIKLKAISYVEKPIDPDEIKESVLEALKNKQKIEKTTDTEKEHRRFAASSLATRLIYPNSASEEELVSDFGKLSLYIDSATTFQTVIFSFKNSIFQGTSHALISFYIQLHDFLESNGFGEIHGIKQDRFLIYHIFGRTASIDFLEQFAATAARLAAVLSNDFFIVMGKNVTGLSSIYESYNSAVMQLQSCFYHPYGSCFLYSSEPSNLHAHFTAPFTMDEFKNLLQQRNLKVTEMAKTLFDTLVYSKNILPNQVKDFYYHCFGAIQETYTLLHLPYPEQKSKTLISLESVSSCETIFELNQLLIQELALFLTQADLSKEESTPVMAIKNFIADHYQDDNLSIKDISDHVFLSTSYICTLFKNETGQTLNQYITKYRVEKAKKLLADPLNKITDISSNVGYSDGNYFGKTFKKIVGLSPTEYRDQVTGQ